MADKVKRQPLFAYPYTPWDKFWKFVLHDFHIEKVRNPFLVMPLGIPAAVIAAALAAYPIFGIFRTPDQLEKAKILREKDWQKAKDHVHHLY